VDLRVISRRPRIAKISVNTAVDRSVASRVWRYPAWLPYLHDERNFCKRPTFSRDYRRLVLRCSKPNLLNLAFKTNTHWKAHDEIYSRRCLWKMEERKYGTRTKREKRYSIAYSRSTQIWNILILLSARNCNQKIWGNREDPGRGLAKRFKIFLLFRVWGAEDGSQKLD